MSTTRPSIEDWFCESTLEKEGIPKNILAALQKLCKLKYF